MKKKIAILGSTGSIGKSLIKILKKDINKYEINLLSADKNYKELLKQAKIFNVKNLIITDKKSYLILKRKIKNNQINIFNNFNYINKILSSRMDYTMSAISGLQGLDPTIKIIKYSKNIAIANKEGIICGWHLLERELKKNKTKFIPVDSEHFSIWYALNGIQHDKIKKVYLTASGGPLINYSLNKIANVSVAKVLKHPNWKMGKKISVDSATMMNKVFEIIEAKNIFKINYKKLAILIHPKSYIHAIILFNNGLIKIIAHEVDMKIPIFNTLHFNDNKIIKSKDLDISKLNDLNFAKVDLKKFPIVKILKLLPSKISLFETIIVSANDELVNLFLKNKIKFSDINKKLINIISNKKFNKYKKIKPKNINEIINLSNYMRSEINSKNI